MHITQLDTDLHHRLDSQLLEYVTPMPSVDGLFQWCRALSQPLSLVVAFNTDGTAKLSSTTIAYTTTTTSSPSRLHAKSESDLRRRAQRRPLQNTRTLQLVDAYRRSQGALSGGLYRSSERFEDVRGVWLSGDTGPDSGFVPADLGRLLEKFPRLEVLCLCSSFRLRHWAVKKNRFSDVDIALTFKHALATLLARRPSALGDGSIEIFWLGVGIELASY
ncbi:hypothetical protein PsYK624_057900 [Phanerochaete sordida]|uniref:Uncharacterized protein n=1 Tax=Phanerochaete sordida TaxID=48140 RepID=A0A9P3G8C4_9APHY|nr:hypothetical protein PsYK624_057900 [Phanerochaete sordida]